MMRIAVPGAFAACFLVVAGCDGPHEKAGELADANAGTAPAGNSFAKGPAEAIGEARDRAARSASEAAEASADAVEDQADLVRRAADQKADALEDQARAMREQGERQADADAARIDAPRRE